MPIYEYQCSQCSAISEEWCKHFEDTSSVACPVCGKDAHRLISRTSFALKGSGWYATEYGTLKDAGKQDSPPDATSASTPGTSSDTNTTTESAGSTGAAPASTPPSTSQAQGQ